jgi:Mlc titration factor MtfA (ptsG expression regulator)
LDDELKTIEIGNFNIGIHKVSLFVSGGQDRVRYKSDCDGWLPIIKIGINRPEWEHVVTALMYEAVELALDNLGCRFIKPYAANSDRLFVFDNKIFFEAMVNAGEFVAAALPLVEEIWKNEQAKLKNGRDRQ